MIIDIHDVGHGACSVITCPNGRRLMVDCGFLGREPYWFPSIAYSGQRVDTLFFGNLDEDHLDDLPYVWKNCPIGAIITNPTVGPAALAYMKGEGGMRDGVSMAHAILRHFGAGAGRIGPAHDLGGVDAWAYYNRFGWQKDAGEFADTNNLSLAVFVRFRGFTILFGGDLETAGWLALLRNPNFVRDLQTVRVFVASHHGRMSGQCEEVFNHCRPDVIIFSDDAKQYDTQETGDWYAARATGIPILDAEPLPFVGYPMRYVLTTRRDGSMKIVMDDAGSRYRILSSAAYVPGLPRVPGLLTSVRS